MGFKKHGTYIHETAKDLFIEVLKIQYLDHKRIKMKVAWFNIGFGRPYLVDPWSNIEIPFDKFKEWGYFEWEADWKGFRKRQENETLNPSNNPSSNNL